MLNRSNSWTIILILFFTFLIVVPISNAQTNPIPTPVPLGQLSLVSELKRFGVFEVFLLALDQSGWLPALEKAALEKAALKKGKLYTVFAPTDAGFANVNGINKDQLFADKKLIKAFVEQHIVEGSFLLNQLSSLDTLISVSGVELMLEHKQPLTVSQAKIVRADLLANNGVIHALGSARFIEK